MLALALMLALSSASAAVEQPPAARLQLTYCTPSGAVGGAARPVYADESPDAVRAIVAGEVARFAPGASICGQALLPHAPSPKDDR